LPPQSRLFCAFTLAPSFPTFIYITPTGLWLHARFYWNFCPLNSRFNGLIPVLGCSGQQGRVGARQYGGDILNTSRTDILSSILPLKFVIRIYARLPLPDLSSFPP
ncbi:hypothetical protein B0H11DRAFT_2182904, partial [Mycena galericulata]